MDSTRERMGEFYLYQRGELFLEPLPPLFSVTWASLGLQQRKAR